MGGEGQYGSGVALCYRNRFKLEVLEDIGIIKTAFNNSVGDILRFIPH